MPTFSTPEPILVSVELMAGNTHITAGERDETVVEVAPRDASRKADVRAAEQTRVEFADGKLLVRSPGKGLTLTRGWAVDVTIALPAGSRVQARTGAGDVGADGTLADCTFKSGAGAIRLGRTGSLQVVSGAGDVTVDGADGDVRVVVGSGVVQIGDVALSATVKSGNGTATIGAAGGDVRVVTGNGDITVERAGRSLVGKTGHGDVRVGALTRGAADLSTGAGDIEVGVTQGSAARLDVRTDRGSVHQQLDATDAPPPSGDRVEIRGRTGAGDITIRRA
jgi:DUF4097 and DUF4098 domain-containing protein YvlB